MAQHIERVKISERTRVQLKVLADSMQKAQAAQQTILQTVLDIAGVNEKDRYRLSPDAQYLILEKSGKRVDKKSPDEKEVDKK